MVPLTPPLKGFRSRKHAAASVMFDAAVPVMFDAATRVTSGVAAPERLVCSDDGYPWWIASPRWSREAMENVSSRCRRVG